MTTEPTRSNRWLSEHARNVCSQNGEDGILEKVLERIGERDRWCVEFGAWDGVALSNTAALIDGQGYGAVLIEADPKKFHDLLARRGSDPKVVPVRAFVGYEGENRLDALLAREAPALPLDFDLLSIDIDGNDYHVWEAVVRYQPKVVVIEYNPSIPKQVDFVQPRDPRLSQGSSLRAIAALAKRKGYELVAVTATNGIFVERRYFDRFEITDNSLEQLWPDEPFVSYLFTGYDGTVFLRGNGTMPWHGLPILEASLQQLPRLLRKYPGSYTRLEAHAARLYGRLRRLIAR